MSTAHKAQIWSTTAGSCWHRLRRHRTGLLGLSLISVLLGVAIFSPLLASDQPIVCRYEGRLVFPAVIELLQPRGDGPHWISKPQPFNLPQFDAKSQLDSDDFAVWPMIYYSAYELTSRPLEPPSGEHWLGTDPLGRDIAARMIHGARASLLVGFLSVGLATLIGLVVGSLAGYCGGCVDMLISRIIEVISCVPMLFLILGIMVWLEPSVWNVILVIGLTRWTHIARHVRAEFLRVKPLEFVLAARALGIGPVRTIFAHILPHALAPVLAIITFRIADAILIEAALSWLGFGVQLPDPSWGNMLRSAYENLRTAPHLVYPPCMAIFLTVLSLNLIGDTLRDAGDPRAMTPR